MTRTFIAPRLASSWWLDPLTCVGPTRSRLDLRFLAITRLGAFQSAEDRVTRLWCGSLGVALDLFARLDRRRGGKAMTTLTCSLRWSWRAIPASSLGSSSRRWPLWNY